MKLKDCPGSILGIAVAVNSLVHPEHALGEGFSVPAKVNGSMFLSDLGHFDEGAVISIQVAGTVDLGNTIKTRPDGALSDVVADVHYLFANPGVASYPVVNGGDRTNHFAGGGLNYDVLLPGYGVAGKTTTDTTDPAAIRLGAVIGTFSTSPARGDWFFIGFSNVVTFPAGGAHLYLAVNDTYYPNNSGSYSAVLTVMSAPQLSISYGVNSVSINWPRTFAGFILESTTSLDPPVVWQGITNAMNVVGSNFTFTVDSTSTSRFFRLRRPVP